MTDASVIVGVLGAGVWANNTPIGLAIVVTALAINLLGDGLRDILDPRMRL